MEKNLEGWGASVESLRKERKNNNNEKALNEIKSYCENDVKMTVLLLYYLVYFQKLSLNGEEYLYKIDKFLQLANNQEEIKESTDKMQSLRD